MEEDNISIVRNFDV
jgi:DNA-directed RNA polymerase II subunit RPB1